MCVLPLLAIADSSEAYLIMTASAEGTMRVSHYWIGVWTVKNYYSTFNVGLLLLLLERNSCIRELHRYVLVVLSVTHIVTVSLQLHVHINVHES